MLINDNLDRGLKDMGESGLKGSQCKHTHINTLTRQDGGESEEGFLFYYIKDKSDQKIFA